MNKRKEAIIAFKMCEQMAELQSILWDLYWEDFLDLMDEQDFTESPNNDVPEVEYPFKSVKDGAGN